MAKEKTSELNHFYKELDFGNDLHSNIDLNMYQYEGKDLKKAQKDTYNLLEDK